MSLAFPRRLALVAGVVLPLGELARRWHQLADPRMLFAWLDDWLLGAFLLYGAWRAGKDALTGQASLAAAWGFTVAIGIDSFYSSLVATDPLDPSGAPMSAVVWIKAAMLSLGIAALVSVLRWRGPALTPSGDRSSDPSRRPGPRAASG
jgi:hypothetical protein